MPGRSTKKGTLAFLHSTVPVDVSESCDGSNQSTPPDSPHLPSIGVQSRSASCASASSRVHIAELHDNMLKDATFTLNSPGGNNHLVTPTSSGIPRSHEVSPSLPPLIAVPKGKHASIHKSPLPLGDHKKRSSSNSNQSRTRLTRARTLQPKASTPQPTTLSALPFKTIDRSSSAMIRELPSLASRHHSKPPTKAPSRTTSRSSSRQPQMRIVESDVDDEDEYVEDEFGNLVPRKTNKHHAKSELERRMEHNSLEAVYASHIAWCKKQAALLDKQRGPDGKLLRPATTKPMEPLLGRKRCASPPTGNAEGGLENTRTSFRTDSILSPFLDVEFEERFDDRLQHVHDRNQDEWIEEVQERKIAQLQEELTVREEAFQRREDRRNRIYEEIASAAERKKREELGARGAKWAQLMCLVMWFVKWKQALHTQNAYVVYRRLLLPILQLRLYSRRKAAARRALIEANLPQNPRPGAETLTLSKEGFFEGWNTSEIGLFLSLLQPISFREGEHIMYAGDYDRVMYIIMTGTVEIQIKKKGKDKRRCRENSTCFPLSTPTYVGEFALLCREPRSASIQCTTDVNGWYIEFSDFEKVLKSLRPDQFDQLERATNARRTQNLINYFPSQVDTLRGYSAFALMPLDMLKAVNSCMTPNVLQRGHVLFNEGDYDPRIYIITDGELCLTTPRSDPSAPPVAVGPGEAVGIFETFFLHECRQYTATVTSNCELWSLTREALNDAGSLYPGVLQLCRANIKDRLAERLATDAYEFSCELAVAAAAAASPTALGGPSHRLTSPTRGHSVTSQLATFATPFAQHHSVVPVPKVLLGDPFLRHCFSTTALHVAWHQVAVPVVAASGDLLQERGKPLSDVFIIVSGRIRIEYAPTHAMSKCNDDVVVDPQLRGAYSLRPPPVQNLARQYPLTPQVEVPEWRKGTHRGGNNDADGAVSSAAEIAERRDKLRAAAAHTTAIHLEDSSTTLGGDDDDNIPTDKKPHKKGAHALLRSLLRGHDGDFGGLYGTSNRADLARLSMITAKSSLLVGSIDLCVNGGISQKSVTCVTKCIAWKINISRLLALTEQHHLHALKDPKFQSFMAANLDNGIRQVLLVETPYVKTHRAYLQSIADKEKAAMEAAANHTAKVSVGGLLTASSNVHHHLSKQRNSSKSRSRHHTLEAHSSVVARSKSTSSTAVVSVDSDQSLMMAEPVGRKSFFAKSGASTSCLDAFPERSNNAHKSVSLPRLPQLSISNDNDDIGSVSPTPSSLEQSKSPSPEPVRRPRRK